MPVFRGVSHVPPGVNIFSDLKTFLFYAEEVEYYTAEYLKRRKQQMKQQKADNYEIRTPVPNPKHTSCNVCGVLFKEGEYKKHIRDEKHAISVKANQNLYNDIDAVIE